MFKKSKIAATAALIAGLLGSSLLAAAPAQAATHKVDADWTNFKVTYAKVAGVRSTLTITPSNKTVVHLATDGSYSYSTYRVVLKGISNKKVYYNKVLSPWRTLFFDASIGYAPDLKTSVVLNPSPQVTSFSTSSLKTFTHYVETKSISALNTNRKAFFKEFGNEDGTLYGPNGDLYDTTAAWAKKNGYPSTFNGYSNYGTTTTGGIKYTVSGKPTSFSVTATFSTGVWVKLTSEKVSGGQYQPFASASSYSAETMGMAAWELYWKK